MADDDDAPTVSVADAASVMEGDDPQITADMSFTVSLSGASGQDITVPYTLGGTATAGSDYEDPQTKSVTISAGSTTADIAVMVKGDTADEGDETVAVTLGTPTNATLSAAEGAGTATGTITDDDDAPVLSVDAPNVAEGADGATATLTFTVTLSPASGKEVTVAYADADTGTATSGTDYQALAAGTLTFAAGDTSKTVAVTVDGDNLDEGDETVVLRLSSPTNATLKGGTATLDATGKITDDDATPTVSIADADAVTEGNDPATTADMSFTVTLSAASGRDVTVPYSLGGTATAGSDYEDPQTKSVTISAGSTSADIAVKVKGDAVDEDNETIEVALGTPTNAAVSTQSGAGTATGTITDDDATPELSADAPSVAEGAQGTTATLTFTVTLSPASGREVSVDYADAGTGTATSGSDYQALAAGTLTFAAGETSKAVAVTVDGDGLDEVNETVVLQLSSASGATLKGGKATLDATGIIVDDDAAPVLSVEDVDPVKEGGSDDAGTLDFTVTLSPASGQTVTVDYEDAETGTATSGTDYTEVEAGKLAFAPGETEKTVRVAIIGDDGNEPDETVVLRFSAPVNAGLPGGVQALTATGTISADDPPAGVASLEVQATDMKLEIGWTAPSGPVTGYDVHRTWAPKTGADAVANDADASGSDPSAGWVPLERGAESDPPATEQAMTGLQNGRAYRVRVRAVNAVGAGIWTFGEGTPPPSRDNRLRSLVVSGSDAADGTFTEQALTPPWPQANNNSYAVRVPHDSTHVKVDAKGHPGARVEVRQSGTYSSGAAVPLKQEGPTSIFVIVAPEAQNAPWRTYTVTVTRLPAPPAAPGSLSVTPDYDSLTLTWTAPSGTVTGYDVEYKERLAPDAPTTEQGDPSKGWVDAGHTGTGVTHKITGLPDDGREYIVRVRARNVSGGGEWASVGADTPYRAAVSISANATVEEGTAMLLDVFLDESNDLPAIVDTDLTFPLTIDLGTAERGDVIDWVDRVATLAVRTLQEAGQSEFWYPEKKGEEFKGFGVILDIGSDYDDAEDETFTLSLDTANLPDGFKAGAQPSVTVTIKDVQTFAAPAGLAVARGDTELSLTWTAPPGEVAGYDVHYTSAPASGSGSVANDAAVQTGQTPSAASGWVTLQRGTESDPPATVQAMTGLQNGTAYRVRVRAKGRGGFGDTGAWAYGTGKPGSSDATLSALAVTGSDAADGTFSSLTLKPDFAADTLAYTVAAAHDVSYVQLTPTAGNADAGTTLFFGSEAGKTVDSGSASDALPLAAGPNEISLRVVSQDGSAERTYTVTVTRAPPPPTGLTLKPASRGTVAEGAGSVEVIAALDVSAIADVSVTLSADEASTASADDDFTLPAPFTIAAGETSKTVAVAIIDDALDEDNETLVLTATAGDLPVTGATLTITDDDALPTASVADADAVTEGNDPATTADMSFTVTLSAASGRDVTVPYSLGGTARAGSDYEDPQTKSVTISAGSTSADIVIKVKGDEADEDNETIEVTLGTLTNATLSSTDGAGSATGTITDDDATLVTAQNVTVAESADNAVLTLSIARPSGETRAVSGTVTPAFTAGTGKAAAADLDSADAVSFTIAGNASSTTVNIPIAQDTVIEGDETFTATIAVTSPTDGAAIAAGPAPTITITDDDTGTVALSIAAAKVAEGGSFDLTATLSGGTLPAGLELTITPTFATAAVGKAAAADMTDSTAKTVTISAGGTTATASFAIADDSADEPDETLQFTLTGTPPDGVTLGTATSHSTRPTTRPPRPPKRTRRPTPWPSTASRPARSPSPSRAATRRSPR